MNITDLHGRLTPPMERRSRLFRDWIQNAVESKLIFYVPVKLSLPHRGLLNLTNTNL